MAVYAVSRPRVLRDAEILRLRAFPSVGEMHVSTGSSVSHDTVLGKYASRQRLRFVRVDVSGDQILATVLVAVGQKVKRGEVLAYYSFMFGLGYTEYTSPCDGEVVGISNVTGQISIKEEPSTLACHLPGIVERVDEAIGVWVRSRGDFLEAAAGTGFARSGRLVRKVDNTSSTAVAQVVGPDDAGKILLVGSCVSQELLEDCLKYRVAGVIAGSAPYRVFQWYENLSASLDWDEFLARYWARELKGRDAVVPRPTEIVPALVMTEGFGEIPMAGEAFDLLASCEGAEVFVDGSSALERDVASSQNAGPCVIVPRHADERAVQAGIKVVDHGVLKEVMPGAKVRVNSLTQAPTEGIVEGVTEEEIVLPNGISVTGVNVTTVDGERLTVPVSNIQVVG